MCIVTQLGLKYPLIQKISRISLLILFPLSLWIALIPIDKYVPQFALSDKILHTLVFFGFSFLLQLAYQKHHHFWLKNGLPLITYGFLIEIFQSLTPYRFFSIWDGVADMLGVIIFWAIWLKCKKTHVYE